MDLKFDFSALWTQVKRVTDELVPFKVEFTHHLDPIDVALSERGVDVVLDEIEDIGNLLSYKGRQILLYIPDHAGSVSNVLAGSAEGKKFHVAHCQTLEKMKEAKRFERYVATTKLDGYFTLTGADYLTGKEIRGDARLLVCKHCLSKLNYKQAALSPATRHKIETTLTLPSSSKRTALASLTSPNERHLVQAAACIRLTGGKSRTECAQMLSGNAMNAKLALPTTSIYFMSIISMATKETIQSRIYAPSAQPATVTSPFTRLFL
jgi:hypothetical protein